MIFRRALFALAGALAWVPSLGAQAPRTPLMDDLMGPGVSLDLARHRAATLSGVRYLPIEGTVRSSLELNGTFGTSDLKTKVKLREAAWIEPSIDGQAECIAVPARHSHADLGARAAGWAGGPRSQALRSSRPTPAAARGSTRGVVPATAAASGRRPRPIRPATSEGCRSPRRWGPTAGAGALQRPAPGWGSCRAARPR